MLALEDLLERANRVLVASQCRQAIDGKAYLELDKTALKARKDLGNCKRLRQELLHLAGTLDRQLVLLAQLVHAQNGDNVLERLVVLEELLDGRCDLVVFLACSIVLLIGRTW